MIPGIFAGGAMGSGGSADPTALSIYNKQAGWWSFDEESDGSSPVNRAVRKASSVNNLTNSAGNVKSTTGRSGSDVAAFFDSSAGRELRGTDGVDAGEIGRVVSGQSMGWYGWLYLTGLGNSTHTLVGKTGSGSPSDTEYIIWLAGDGNIRLNTGGSSGINVATPSPGGSQWIFVAAWVDESDMKSHIQLNNGTIATSSSAVTYAPTSALLNFGRFAGTFELSGRLQDWLCMFGTGKFLDEDERTYLYNAGAGRTWDALYAAAGSP